MEAGQTSHKKFNTCGKKNLKHLQLQKNATSMNYYDFSFTFFDFYSNILWLKFEYDLKMNDCTTAIQQYEYVYEHS